jgi:predicted lipoprotein with Yx(FWY)xxD motif
MKGRQSNSRGEVTVHHRNAKIASGAIVLSTLLAVAADAAAVAATPFRSPVSPSTASTLEPLIGDRSVAITTVHTAVVSVNGTSERILVNSRDLPLYYYPADTAKKSVVSGELARLWPPLLAAKLTATGLKGTLGTLKVSTGHQVTYNGHFLYTFIEDTPGHVSGQGVSNFSVATPHLKPISAASTNTSSASSLEGSNGY